MKLAPLFVLTRLAVALPSNRRVSDVLERARRQQQRTVGTGPRLTDAADNADDGGGVAAAGGGDVVASYLEQRLDHFSEEREDKRVTFRQRYFHTPRYVRSGDGKRGRRTVAFLCVGGEGPSLDTSVLVDSVHCTGDMIGLAEELFRLHGFDVHLFALEHRYYGESFPAQPGGLRGDAEPFRPDYAHLSSRQAVRDVAAFVQSEEALDRIDVPRDSAQSVPWVTFGGSYPGMLSAWSRLLHPEAIFAAVSSSAPVEARLDFREYYEHVGSDLEDEDVGGSGTCRAVVEEGHGQVAALLEGVDGNASGDGLDRVAEFFNVCGGAEKLRESARNRDAFVGDGLITIPAQGNDPSCKGKICNIKGLCSVIVDDRRSNPDKTSMEILADVRKLQKNGTCDYVDWKYYVDWYKTPNKQNANDISWLYQTCSEFGFYQTCNKDSRCPYGRGFHKVSQDLEVCQAVFGIAPDDARNNVDSTLTYYGGWDLTPNTGEQAGPNHVLEAGGKALEGQKRIIFVTGDVDPWTELSLTKGDENHPTVSVRRASHHFWTHKVKDSDSEYVSAARRAIYDAVSGWLGVPPARFTLDGGDEAATV